MTPEKSGAPPDLSDLTDAEILKFRFRDLRLAIATTDVQDRVEQLYREMESKGLNFNPQIFLGDEWFSPEGMNAISVPFYFAHTRLRQLEKNLMLEVEGGNTEWFMRLLRHEAGHCFDHCFRFSKRKKWHQVFGSPNLEYQPDTYRPQPYSRSYVKHLDNWYAQAHPDEDFAETFAVWLGMPKDEWQSRYKGWKALEKLEYMDSLMREASKKPPLVTGGPRPSNAQKLRSTLSRYYAARRKLWAEDTPDFYDSDLRRIFWSNADNLALAAQFMRRHRKAIVASVVLWTGERKYVVDGLLRKLIGRASALRLRAPEDQVSLALGVGSYLASLVTNHLHTGRFKRSV